MYKFGSLSDKQGWLNAPHESETRGTRTWLELLASDTWGKYDDQDITDPYIVESRIKTLRQAPGFSELPFKRQKELAVMKSADWARKLADVVGASKWDKQAQSEEDYFRELTSKPEIHKLPANLRALVYKTRGGKAFDLFAKKASDPELSMAINEPERWVDWLKADELSKKTNKSYTWLADEYIDSQQKKGSMADYVASLGSDYDKLTEAQKVEKLSAVSPGFARYAEQYKRTGLRGIPTSYIDILTKSSDELKGRLVDISGVDTKVKGKPFSELVNALAADPNFAKMSKTRRAAVLDYLVRPSDKAGSVYKDISTQLIDDPAMMLSYGKIQSPKENNASTSKDYVKIAGDKAFGKEWWGGGRVSDEEFVAGYNDWRAVPKPLGADDKISVTPDTAKKNAALPAVEEEKYIARIGELKQESATERAALEKTILDEYKSKGYLGKEAIAKRDDDPRYITALAREQYYKEKDADLIKGLVGTAWDKTAIGLGALVVTAWANIREAGRFHQGMTPEQIKAEMERLKDRLATGKTIPSLAEIRSTMSEQAEAAKRKAWEKQKTEPPIVNLPAAIDSTPRQNIELHATAPAPDVDGVLPFKPGVKGIPGNLDAVAQPFPHSMYVVGVAGDNDAVAIIPGAIWDNRDGSPQLLSQQQAIDLYNKTNKHYGIFADAADAHEHLKGLRSSRNLSKPSDVIAAKALAYMRATAGQGKELTEKYYDIKPMEDGKYRLEPKKGLPTATETDGMKWYAAQVENDERLTHNSQTGNPFKQKWLIPDTRTAGGKVNQVVLDFNSTITKMGADALKTVGMTAFTAGRIAENPQGWAREEVSSEDIAKDSSLYSAGKAIEDYYTITKGVLGNRDPRIKDDLNFWTIEQGVWSMLGFITPSAAARSIIRRATARSLVKGLTKAKQGIVNGMGKSWRLSNTPGVSGRLAAEEAAKSAASVARLGSGQYSRILNRAMYLAEETAGKAPTIGETIAAIPSATAKLVEEEIARKGALGVYRAALTGGAVRGPIARRMLWDKTAQAVLGPVPVGVLTEGSGFAEQALESQGSVPLGLLAVAQTEGGFTGFTEGATAERLINGSARIATRWLDKLAANAPTTRGLVGRLRTQTLPYLTEKLESAAVEFAQEKISDVLQASSLERVSGVSQSSDYTSAWVGAILGAAMHSLGGAKRIAAARDQVIALSDQRIRQRVAQAARQIRDTNSPAFADVVRRINQEENKKAAKMLSDMLEEQGISEQSLLDQEKAMGRLLDNIQRGVVSMDDVSHNTMFDSTSMVRDEASAAPTQITVGGEAIQSYEVVDKRIGIAEDGRAIVSTKMRPNVSAYIVGVDTAGRQALVVNSGQAALENGNVSLPGGKINVSAVINEDGTVDVESIAAMVSAKAAHTGFSGNVSLDSVHREDVLGADGQMYTTFFFASDGGHITESKLANTKTILSDVAGEGAAAGAFQRYNTPSNNKTIQGKGKNTHIPGLHTAFANAEKALQDAGFTSTADITSEVAAAKPKSKKKKAQTTQETQTPPPIGEQGETVEDTVDSIEQVGVEPAPQEGYQFIWENPALPATFQYEAANDFTGERLWVWEIPGVWTGFTPANMVEAKKKLTEIFKGEQNAPDVTSSETVDRAEPPANTALAEEKPVIDNVLSKAKAREVLAATVRTGKELIAELSTLIPQGKGQQVRIYEEEDNYMPSAYSSHLSISRDTGAATLHLAENPRRTGLQNQMTRMQIEDRVARQFGGAIVAYLGGNEVVNAAWRNMPEGALKENIRRAYRRKDYGGIEHDYQGKQGRPDVKKDAKYASSALIDMVFQGDVYKDADGNVVIKNGNQSHVLPSDLATAIETVISGAYEAATGLGGQSVMARHIATQAEMSGMVSGISSEAQEELVTPPTQEELDTLPEVIHDDELRDRMDGTFANQQEHIAAVLEGLSSAKALIEKALGGQRVRIEQDTSTDRLAWQQVATGYDRATNEIVFRYNQAALASQFKQGLTNREHVDNMIWEEIIHATALHLGLDEQISQAWMAIPERDKETLRRVYRNSTDGALHGAAEQDALMFGHELVRAVLQSKLALEQEIDTEGNKRSKITLTVNGVPTEVSRGIKDILRDVFQRLLNFIRGIETSDEAYAVQLRGITGILEQALANIEVIEAADEVAAARDEIIESTTTTSEQSAPIETAIPEALLETLSEDEMTQEEYQKWLMDVAARREEFTPEDIARVNIAAKRAFLAIRMGLKAIGELDAEPTITRADVRQWLTRPQSVLGASTAYSDDYALDENDRDTILQGLYLSRIEPLSTDNNKTLATKRLYKALSANPDPDALLNIPDVSKTHMRTAIAQYKRAYAGMVEAQNALSLYLDIPIDLEIGGGTDSAAFWATRKSAAYSSGLDYRGIAQGDIALGIGYPIDFVRFAPRAGSGADMIWLEELTHAALFIAGGYGGQTEAVVKDTTKAQQQASARLYDRGVRNNLKIALQDIDYTAAELMRQIVNMRTKKTTEGFRFDQAGYHDGKITEQYMGARSDATYGHNYSKERLGYIATIGAIAKAIATQSAPGKSSVSATSHAALIRISNAALEILDSATKANAENKQYLDKYAAMLSAQTGKYQSSVKAEELGKVVPSTAVYVVGRTGDGTGIATRDGGLISVQVQDGESYGEAAKRAASAEGWNVSRIAQYPLHVVSNGNGNAPSMYVAVTDVRKDSESARAITLEQFDKLVPREASIKPEFRQYQNAARDAYTWLDKEGYNLVSLGYGNAMEALAATDLSDVSQEIIANALIQSDPRYATNPGNVIDTETLAKAQQNINTTVQTITNAGGKGITYLGASTEVEPTNPTWFAKDDVPLPGAPTGFSARAKIAWGAAWDYLADSTVGEKIHMDEVLGLFPAGKFRQQAADALVAQGVISQDGHLIKGLSRRPKAYIIGFTANGKLAATVRDDGKLAFPGQRVPLGMPFGKAAYDGASHLGWAFDDISEQAIHQEMSSDGEFNVFFAGLRARALDTYVRAEEGYSQNPIDTDDIKLLDADESLKNAAVAYLASQYAKVTSPANHGKIGNISADGIVAQKRQESKLRALQNAMKDNRVESVGAMYVEMLTRPDLWGKPLQVEGWRSGVRKWFSDNGMKMEVPEINQPVSTVYMRPSGYMRSRMQNLGGIEDTVDIVYRVDSPAIWKGDELISPAAVWFRTIPSTRLPRNSYGQSAIEQARSEAEKIVPSFLARIAQGDEAALPEFQQLVKDARNADGVAYWLLADQLQQVFTQQQANQQEQITTPPESLDKLQWMSVLPGSEYAVLKQAMTRRGYTIISSNLDLRSNSMRVRIKAVPTEGARAGLSTVTNAYIPLGQDYTSQDVLDIIDAEVLTENQIDAFFRMRNSQSFTEEAQMSSVSELVDASASLQEKIDATIQQYIDTIRGRFKKQGKDIDVAAEQRQISQILNMVGRIKLAWGTIGADGLPILTGSIPDSITRPARQGEHNEWQRMSSTMRSAIQQIVSFEADALRVADALDTLETGKAKWTGEENAWKTAWANMLEPGLKANGLALVDIRDLDKTSAGSASIGGTVKLVLRNTKAILDGTAPADAVFEVVVPYESRYGGTEEAKYQGWLSSYATRLTRQQSTYKREQRRVQEHLDNQADYIVRLAVGAGRNLLVSPYESLYVEPEVNAPDTVHGVAGQSYTPAVDRGRLKQRIVYSDDAATAGDTSSLSRSADVTFDSVEGVEDAAVGDDIQTDEDIVGAEESTAGAGSEADVIERIAAGDTVVVGTDLSGITAVVSGNLMEKLPTENALALNKRLAAEGYVNPTIRSAGGETTLTVWYGDRAVDQVTIPVQYQGRGELPIGSTVNKLSAAIAVLNAPSTAQIIEEAFNGRVEDEISDNEWQGEGLLQDFLSTDVSIDTGLQGRIDNLLAENKLHRLRLETNDAGFILSAESTENGKTYGATLENNLSDKSGVSEPFMLWEKAITDISRQVSFFGASTESLSEFIEGVKETDITPGNLSAWQDTYRQAIRPLMEQARDNKQTIWEGINDTTYLTSNVGAVIDKLDVADPRALIMAAELLRDKQTIDLGVYAADMEPFGLTSSGTVSDGVLTDGRGRIPAGARAIAITKGKKATVPNTHHVSVAWVLNPGSDPSLVPQMVTVMEPGEQMNPVAPRYIQSWEEVEDYGTERIYATDENVGASSSAAEQPGMAGVGQSGNTSDTSTASRDVGFFGASTIVDSEFAEGLAEGGENISTADGYISGVGGTSAINTGAGSVLNGRDAGNGEGVGSGYVGRIPETYSPIVPAPAVLPPTYTRNGAETTAELIASNVLNTWKPAVEPKINEDIKKLNANGTLYGYQAYAADSIRAAWALRRAFILADGTGVGKTRALIAAVLDVLLEGKQTVIYVTANETLINSDKALLGDTKAIFAGAKEQPADAGANINFTTPADVNSLSKNDKRIGITYDWLMNAMKTEAGAAKLRDVLGKDFSGYILLDEVHKARTTKALSGKEQGSNAEKKAPAVRRFLEMFPKAHVAFATATPFTDLSDMGIYERLGVFGKDKLIGAHELAAGDTASITLAMLDLQRNGQFLARALNPANVNISSPPITLTEDEQRTWVRGLETIKRLKDWALGANIDSAAKSSLNSWITELPRVLHTTILMNKVLPMAEADIKAGRIPIITIADTYAKREEKEEAEEAKEKKEEAPYPEVLKNLDEWAQQRFGKSKSKSKSKDKTDTYSELLKVEGIQELLNMPTPMATALAWAQEQNGINAKPIYLYDANSTRKARALTAHGKVDEESKAAGYILTTAGAEGISLPSKLPREGMKDWGKVVNYLVDPSWSPEIIIQFIGRGFRANQGQVSDVVFPTLGGAVAARILGLMSQRAEQVNALMGMPDVARLGRADGLEYYSPTFIAAVNGDELTLDEKLSQEQSLGEWFGVVKEDADIEQTVSNFLNKVLLNGAVGAKMFDRLTKRLEALRKPNAPMRKLFDGIERRVYKGDILEDHVTKTTVHGIEVERVRLGSDEYILAEPRQLVKLISQLTNTVSPIGTSWRRVERSVVPTLIQTGQGDTPNLRLGLRLDAYTADIIDHDFYPGNSKSGVFGTRLFYIPSAKENALAHKAASQNVGRAINGYVTRGGNSLVVTVTRGDEIEPLTMIVAESPNGSTRDGFIVYMPQGHRLATQGRTATELTLPPPPPPKDDAEKAKLKAEAKARAEAETAKKKAEDEARKERGEKRPPTVVVAELVVTPTGNTAEFVSNKSRSKAAIAVQAVVQREIDAFINPEVDSKVEGKSGRVSISTIKSLDLWTSGASTVTEEGADIDIDALVSSLPYVINNRSMEDWGITANPTLPRITPLDPTQAYAELRTNVDLWRTAYVNPRLAAVSATIDGKIANGAADQITMRELQAEIIDSLASARLNNWLTGFDANGRLDEAQRGYMQDDFGGEIVGLLQNLIIMGWQSHGISDDVLNAYMGWRTVAAAILSSANGHINIQAAPLADALHREYERIKNATASNRGKDTAASRITTDVDVLSAIEQAMLRYGQKVWTTTRGMHLRNAAGEYDTTTQAMSNRAGRSDVATTLHEFGHHLQISGRLSPLTLEALTDKFSKTGVGAERMAELFALASSGNTKKERMTEGFAQFFSMYHNNPLEALRSAPKLYEYFEQEVLATNKVLAKTSRLMRRATLAMNNHASNPMAQGNVAPLSPAVDWGKIFTRDFWSDLGETWLGIKDIDGQRLTDGRIRSAWHAIMVSLFDDKAGIRYFEEWLARQGNVLPSETMYERYRLLTAKIAQTADIFLSIGMVDATTRKIDYNGGLKAILNPVNKNAHENEFAEFLVALRTLERGARTGAQDGSNAARPLDNAGATNEQMAHSLAVLRQAGYTTAVDPYSNRITPNDIQRIDPMDNNQYAYFWEQAQKLYKYQDKVLRYAVDSGAISGKSYAAIKKLNDFYISFARVMDGDVSDEKGKSAKATDWGVITPGGLASAEARIHGLRGSGRTIQNPISTLYSNTTMLVMMAERAKVKRMFYDYATTMAGAGKKLIVEKQARKTNTVSRQQFEQLAGNVLTTMGLTKADIDAVYDGLNAFYTSEPLADWTKGEFNVLVDGELKTIRVNDAELLKSLQNTNPATFGVLRRIAMIPGQALRLGAVLLNPAFSLFKNPMRDTLSATFFGQYRFVPIYDTVRFIGTARRYAQGKLDPNNPKDAMALEAMTHGGIGAMSQSQHKDAARHLFKEVFGLAQWKRDIAARNLANDGRPMSLSKAMSYGQNALSYVWNSGFSPLNLVAKGYVDFTKAAAETSEVATRLGVYSAAREGKFKPTAISDHFDPNNVIRGIQPPPGAGVPSLLDKASETLGIQGYFGKNDPWAVTPHMAAMEARRVPIDFERRGSGVGKWNRYAPFFSVVFNELLMMGDKWRQNKYDFVRSGLLFTALSALTMAAGDDDDDYKGLQTYQKDGFWHLPTTMFGLGSTGAKWVRFPKPFAPALVFGTLTERIAADIQGDPAAWDGIMASIGNAVPILGDVQDPTGMIPPGVKQILENISNYNYYTGSPIVPAAIAELTPLDQYNQNTRTWAIYASQMTAALTGKTLEISPMKIEHFVKGTGSESAVALLDSLTELGISVGAVERKTAQGLDTPWWQLAPGVGSTYRAVLYDPSPSYSANIKLADEISKDLKALQTKYQSTIDGRQGRFSKARVPNDKVEAMQEIISEYEDMAKENRRQIFAVTNDIALDKQTRSEIVARLGQENKDAANIAIKQLIKLCGGDPREYLKSLPYVEIEAEDFPELPPPPK